MNLQDASPREVGYERASPIAMIASRMRRAARRVVCPKSQAGLTSLRSIPTRSGARRAVTFFTWSGARPDGSGVPTAGGETRGSSSLLNRGEVFVPLVGLL